MEYIMNSIYRLINYRIYISGYALTLFIPLFIILFAMYVAGLIRGYHIGKQEIRKENKFIEKIGADLD